MTVTPIRTVTYESDRNRADRISINSGLALHQGIIRLAQAAALEERLDDGSHTEVMLWFLVRSLCEETGHDYDEAVRTGREYAGQL